MTFRVMTVLAVGMVGALLGGASLSAHHSLASQFDEGKPLTLQGVISKVEWVNPHVWVHIDVKDTSGAVEQWALETLPPATLRKGGLRSDMLGKGANGDCSGLPGSKRIEVGFSPQDHVC